MNQSQIPGSALSVVGTTLVQWVTANRPSAWCNIAGRLSLSADQADTLERIRDVARLPGRPIGGPFRAPHYSVSDRGLVGAKPTPCRTFGDAGEVHLAHGGVLYLDDVGAFTVGALRYIREALIEGQANGIPCRPRVLVLQWCAPGRPCSVKALENDAALQVAVAGMFR